MLDILSVTSECVPLIKTGGLADVAGALPKALGTLGHRMRTLLPAYPGLVAKLTDTRVVWSDPDLFGGPAQVIFGTVASEASGGEGTGATEILLLQAPHLFDRAGGPYLDLDGVDFADNPERFAALSWVGAQIAMHGTSDGWRPRLVHCHDWQAALVPSYLKFAGHGHIPTILTIHNMAFQGLAPADRTEALRLPWHEFHADSFEYFGQISALKAGLKHAWKLTTVSPTYAGELMRPEFGMGMDGIIRDRSTDMVGILNGIDLDLWNPQTCDTPYGLRTLKKKANARRALAARFGIHAHDAPLAIVVSRLSHQKGLDLLAECLPEFIEQGGAVAVLGTGDKALEQAFRDLGNRYPGRVGVEIDYDEELSHLMFAGGDAVLIPSRFEPCGLTQLYGLRFGTLPLVAATGGLADTVIDANPAALAMGVATGFTFHPTEPIALSFALERLLMLFAQPDLWTQMQRNAMKQPVGWDTSAAAYIALYESLTSEAAP
ncbi:Glycogen synthase 1 [Aquimixticola soesokkakensis]|uniref:Glycogen synthase n=1 Tax=Aquimixticola soesokkakensis TaxID=1519096 RepID=A0A1Y5SNP6_9RHOB|nr:glycogen synthase GlgA [Aquimixticola soesokkakensis]SLN44905.1 Glycogen synthase 1 [Aquimixticola soesokkakensis]